MFNTKTKKPLIRFNMSSDIIPSDYLGKMDLIEKIHTEKNMLELTEE